MKPCNLSTKALFLIPAIFGYIGQSCAEDSNTIPTMKVLWQKEVTADANLDCSLGQIALDKTNERLLIAGTSFRPKVYSEGKLWLMEVDTNSGDIAKKTTVRKVAESKATIMLASSLIKGLVVSEHNDISLIGKFDSSTQSIMKVNRQGNVNNPIEFIEKNNREKESILVLNRITLPGDNFLLIGRDEDGNGVAMKIGPDGIKLWEKTYKVGQGQTDLFSDGSSIGNDGDFIIVGCSANVSSKPRALGQSDDFILQCDSQGNILKREFFSAGSGWPNKLPQICQINGGNLLIVYDKDTRFAASDIIMRAYSSDLRLLWEKEVLKSESIVLFKITPVKENGFVLVAKVVSGDLKVHQYDGKGNQIAGIAIDSKDYLIVSSPSIAWVNNNVFVVAQGVPEGEKGSEVSKIKIIALELK
ncbi:MAG: hypothetical protein WC454_02860 [Phycisphaerae bacterium]